MTPGRLVETSSSTPLMLLSLAAIDTETTGLDPATARIIEVAGVRVERGSLKDDDAFSHLVDPGIAVPAASTAIHGLSAGDLAGAAGFADVAGAFERWIGDSVVLGYALGFDLSVLKCEYERCGLLWRSPRSLDVRHLVGLLRPELPDYALETLASWLGVAVQDRHRAAGDAATAARIYLALVPRLFERGISTLAEAEAACRSMAFNASPELGAPWDDVARPVAGMRRRSAGLARIDSDPYRRRVRDVMSPPLFVAADTRLRDVLRLMIERKVSSVFVEAGPGDCGPGIITERDLLRVIDAAPEVALRQPAHEAASRPLQTVSDSAYIYRALGRMNRRGFRHLGVTDGNGAIVGALSARRLLRQRAEAAIWLGESLDEATTPQELGAVWAEMTLVARALMADEVDVRAIAAVISRELCALTARACELAEQELTALHGPAPVDYAMLVLGSGGRGESLLAMDQDNAIVYGAGEPGGPEDKWLAELGARVADTLNMAGVAYCKGGVMARNAQWRMSRAGWRATVRRWLSRSQPEDILSTDIFFDAVPVHGAVLLGEDVRNEALETAGRADGFLKLMAVNAARFEVPLGWFGRFKLEDRRMDVKRGGLMPIFSAARVLALRHGVRARSTPERLAAVRGKGDADPALINRLTEAHKILLGAILAQQLDDIEAGVKPSNRVAPEALSAAEADRLRWALEQVGSVPNVLGDPLAFA